MDVSGEIGLTLRCLTELLFPIKGFIQTAGSFVSEL